MWFMTLFSDDTLTFLSNLWRNKANQFKYVCAAHDKAVKRSICSYRFYAYMYRTGSIHTYTLDCMNKKYKVIPVSKWNILYVY